MVNSCTNLAFGDWLSCTNPTTTNDKAEFTGQWTDPYGMASFPARSDSLGQGRWATTDPAGMAAADPGDPQTWNRYAYVNNNPVSNTDPSGLCDVVVGGFAQTPGTASTSTQQAFATAIRADQAYPFSGLNGVQSYGAAQFGSLGEDVTRNAILNAAAQSSGSFNIYAFSGGAQEVANVWSSLPQSVQSNANIMYISPGRVPFGSSLPPGGIYQGQGPVDSLLTSLSPNGSIVDCGHDANCAFGALWLGGIIGRGNPMRAPQACGTPTTFTRQNPAGGAGSSPSGGFWNWFPTAEPYNWTEGSPTSSWGLYPVWWGNSGHSNMDVL